MAGGNTSKWHKILHFQFLIFESWCFSFQPVTLNFVRLVWRCHHWATTPCFLTIIATLFQLSSNEVWMSHYLRMTLCKFTWQKNHWWKNTALLLRYSLLPLLFCSSVIVLSHMQHEICVHVYAAHTFTHRYCATHAKRDEWLMSILIVSAVEAQFLWFMWNCEELRLSIWIFTCSKGERSFATSLKTL